MLREFRGRLQLDVDWTSIDAAPNEALVNALAMMCPFGSNEKQALLEAVDLRRAPKCSSRWPSSIWRRTATIAPQFISRFFRRCGIYRF